MTGPCVTLCVYAVTALLSVSERCVGNTCVQSDKSLAKERGLCNH